MHRYIDTDEAIKVILSGKIDDNSSLVECPEECNSFLDGAVDDISKIPAADVRENVRGKWLFEDGSIATGELQDKNVHCSICGHSAPGKPWWECDLELTNFCPNCGARMERRDDNEKNGAK